MLVAGGNLIRKVLFPAEILPIVTVLTGLVNFAFSLLILAAFLAYYARPVSVGELAWLPVIVLVQLTFTLGLSLLLSSLTVHFRDLRDLRRQPDDALVLGHADHLLDVAGPGAISRACSS